MRWWAITAATSVLAAVVALGVAEHRPGTVGMILTAVVAAVVVARSGISRFLGGVGAAAFALGTYVSEAELGRGAATTARSALATPVKVLPFALLGLVAAGLLMHRRGAVIIDRGQRWLFAYLLWLTFCAAIAPTPGFAVLRVAQAALPVAVALLVATSRVEAERLFAAVIVGCIGLGVYGILVPTAYEYEQRARGLVTADTYGVVGAILVVTAIGVWKEHMFAHAAFLAASLASIGAYAIVRSQTRTAAAAAFVGVGAMLLVRHEVELNTGSRRRRRRLIVLAAVLVIGGFTFESAAVARWLSRDETPSSLATLTGRTDLWQVSLNLIAERPVTGFGPASTRSGPVERRIREAVDFGGNAHNALIEATLSGGLVGGALWLLAMIRLWRYVLSVRSQIKTILVGNLTIVSVSALALAAPAGFGVLWFLVSGIIGVATSASPALRRAQPVVHRSLLATTSQETADNVRL